MCKYDALCIRSHTKDVPGKWRGKAAAGSSYVNTTISWKVFCFLSGSSVARVSVLSS